MEPPRLWTRGAPSACATPRSALALRPTRGACAPMKLSQENARRLSALVWRERLRRFAPIVLAGLVLTALLTVFLVRQVEQADRPVSVAVHNATVLTVKQGGGAGPALVPFHLG